MPYYNVNPFCYLHAHNYVTVQSLIARSKGSDGPVIHKDLISNVDNYPFM